MGGDRASDRILVVEDDPDARDEMALVLRSEGYDVAAAGDGEEALAELRRATPALILLDLMMPVMDGWQFANELKARDEDIPIVLLSAARDLKNHAREMNAADVIEKPFDLSELIPKIERVAAS